MMEHGPAKAEPYDCHGPAEAALRPFESLRVALSEVEGRQAQGGPELRRRTGPYIYALKQDLSRTRVTIPDANLDDEEAFSRIRCPLCAWRPSPSDRWSCVWTEGSPEPPFPSCGAIWNTFKTRGTCPGCHHHWRWTSCLACAGWSLHEDWYEVSPA